MDKQEDTPQEAQIIFTGRHLAAATGMFNGNAFPDHTEGEVNVCADRLALFFYNVERFGKSMAESKAEFLKQLLTWKEIIPACRREIDWRLRSDNLIYMTDFHSVLYSLKAFLDVYARSVCRLVNPNASPTGFGKRKVDGVVLAGGKFLKWIEKQNTTCFPQKARFCTALASHARNWISQAVGFRDTLAHLGKIKDMQEMRVLLPAQEVRPAAIEVLPPVLPSGEMLDAYCSQIMEKTGAFLNETLFLLPNIDEKLVQTWSWSSRMLNGLE